MIKEDLSLKVKYAPSQGENGIRVDQKFDRVITKYMEKTLGAVLTGRGMGENNQREVNFRIKLGREVERDGKNEKNNHFLALIHIEAALQENAIDMSRIAYRMTQDELDETVKQFGPDPKVVEPKLNGFPIWVIEKERIKPGDIRRVWYQKHWWRCKVRTSANLDKHWYIMLIDDKGNDVKETVREECELLEFVKAGGEV